MRYESLLASRYIKAQKRQSAFTVISIATAVAVMTMIFLLYSVLMNCYRNTVYSMSPYHLAFRGLTEEQGEALRKEEQICSVKLERAEDGTVTALVLFDSDIGDREQWLQKAAQHIGAERQFQKNRYAWNEELMQVDMIGNNAHLFRLQIFCIFFIFAVVMAFALRLIIDTAFEVSSKERERHYGVLQSVGATPEQIVRIITLEGMQLCVIAVPLGLGAGILLAYGMYNAVLAAGFAELFQGMTNAQINLPFSIDPKMLLVAAAFGILWVFLSAYGVGMRIIKKPPMEAIITRSDEVKKVRRHSLSGLLFGISGSIAYRNARRQKKRFVITVLTLTISVTMFAMFSTMTDTLERTANGFMSAGMDDADFMVSLTEVQAKGITYEDGLREITDSGMFRNVAVNVLQQVKLPEDDRIYYVEYLNKEWFGKYYGESSPVSYEELVRTGGYVLNSAAKDYPEFSAGVSGDTLALDSIRLTLPAQQTGDDMSRMEVMKSVQKEQIPHTITVLGTAKENATFASTGSVLVGALETYRDVHEAWYGDVTVYTSCSFSYRTENNYNTEDYKKIIDWFNDHIDMISIDMDNYGTRWTTRNVMSSVRAGMLILNVIIALAALINLMNIISTGLANRRSELASMQCIGMTDLQLDRMTMIESLQFAGTAAILSVLLCAVIIFGSETVLTKLINMTFVDESQKVRDLLTGMIRMDHVTPFLRAAAASFVAFAAGCGTSLVMLRRQGQESLSDQIRGSEMRIDTKQSHLLRNSVIAVAAAAVLVIAGLRIYTVASFRHDREEFARAGYLDLVDANGMQMNVYSTGAEHGKHTIVGIAGYGVNSFPVLTAKLNEQLGKENTVVYPDRAGYGFTDDSLKKQTLAQVVEDYRAGLKSAGFAPPYVLMGHSIGGYYALWWEMQYPDEVEAIVLLDGTEVPESDLWFSGMVEQMYPSEAAAKADTRRLALRTWLGLDRLFAAKDPEGHIYGASVLTEEQIRLWELSDNRSYSAASVSEMLLMDSAYRELTEKIKPTSTPKLYLSTTPACMEDVREAEEFVKADREAVGKKYASDPETVAKGDWQAFGWQCEDYYDTMLTPFLERIGSARYVTIGGDHGIFYAQKPEQTAEEILNFLAETE
ncbi:MAG: alpha/beta fold hydrolase [Oscillospiraceae bacterium]|nr:alpha/beta fold hydrolase [Oscillospiraceae bacterium]